MSLNLGLLLRESASSYPDNVALAIGDTDLTYRTVDNLARRFASKSIMSYGNVAIANVPRSQAVVSKLLCVKRRWKPTEFPSAPAT